MKKCNYFTLGAALQNENRLSFCKVATPAGDLKPHADSLQPRSLAAKATIRRRVQGSFLGFITLICFLFVLFLSGCDMTASYRKSLLSSLSAMDDVSAVSITLDIRIFDDTQEKHTIINSSYAKDGDSFIAKITQNYINWYIYKDFIYKSDIISWTLYELEDNRLAAGDSWINASGELPIFADIDSLTASINENSLSRKKEGDLFRYSFVAKDSYISEILTQFSDTEFAFEDSFTISILTNRKSGELKKIEYNTAPTNTKSTFNAKLEITINSVNEMVEVNIPKNVVDIIDDYAERPTLTILYSPTETGLTTEKRWEKAGREVTLTATEKNGFDFIGWHEGEQLISDYYEYQFEMPSYDYILTAIYTPLPPVYELSVNYEAGKGSVSYYSSSLSEGEFVSLRAKPTQRSNFFGWFEGETKISDALEYSFIMPARDISLYAKFGSEVEKSYTDSADGAVKYSYLDSYKDIAFDAQTGKYAVLRESSVDIYSESFILNKTLTFTNAPKAIAVDGGMLAVGFGDATEIYNKKYVYIYDLSEGTELGKISVLCSVGFLYFDGDTVGYSEKENWTFPALILYNIKDNSETQIYEIGRIVSFNREKHEVYIDYNKSLLCFDSQSGEKKSEVRIVKSIENATFDGKNLHLQDGVFDIESSTLISSGRLGKHYNELQSFTPQKTLYDSDDIAFVLGCNELEPEIAVYDNINGKYIYRFDFTAMSVERLSSSIFLAKNTLNNTIALIDLSLIDGEIEGNLPERSCENTITEQGEVKQLTYFDSYELFTADENYIYLIGHTTSVLSVYDKETLDEVYSERLLCRPSSMDAYSGKLVIGFKDFPLLRVYNVSDWSFSHITIENPATRVVVHKDVIIYLEEYVSFLRIYNLSEGTFIVKPMSVFTSSMEVNREDEILYFGGRYFGVVQLIYLSLKTLEFVYESENNPNFERVKEIRFDGEFVHFYRNTFNKITGELVSITSEARPYSINELESIKTIYDDGRISVFTAMLGPEAYTYFYNIETNQVIKQLDEKSRAIIKIGDSYCSFGQLDRITFITI